jgi:hypothetical protein
MKNVFKHTILFSLLFALGACSAGGVQTAPASSSASQASVTTSSTARVAVTSVAPVATSVPGALAENSPINEDADDYTWDSATEVSITLNGDSITADGQDVTVEGSTVIINSIGTYRLSGTLTDGQIVVDTDDKGVVRLIFDGIDIRNSTSTPINIVKAEKTVIVLADNTKNFVTDGASYVFTNPEDDEPNATVFSKGDLTITGDGALTVTGNFNDGIASKDGLLIDSGTLIVSAADDGIRGKDYLVIKDGRITVTAQGDGLKSDNEEDATKGYISIETGVINITSGSDAITAQTDVLIAGGEFTLISGGGSTNRLADTVSAKGIKGLVSVNIDGGTFNIDAADDALHSNNNLIVNGGNFSIASGDDGLHADATLTINGGEIQVTRSYEGIESAVITINNGTIHVVASDDGLNVAGGADGSGMMMGGRPGGRPGQETFNYTGSNYLYVNGGYTVVEADGDGVDVNGAIEMKAGTLLVSGPTEQMNGALDYDAGFKLTGGLLVAAGSSGMAQAPDASSTQPSVLIYLAATQPAGTLIHVQNSAGQDILTFAPTHDYQSVAFSSPQLVNGETYTVFVGGSSTGTATDGLYQGGTYTPGIQLATFTVSSAVTLVGTGGMGGRRPGRF